jgi:hypothetical protein
MIVTRDQAVLRADQALIKLRAFDQNNCTVSEMITFVSEMEDIARGQAADLRETLAFLEDNGEEYSDYAFGLRNILPMMDRILCQMAEVPLPKPGDTVFPKGETS